MITNSTLFHALMWAVDHTDKSEWIDPCWTVNGQREVYVTFDGMEFKTGSISEYDFLLSLECFRSETGPAIAYYIQHDCLNKKLVVGIQCHNGDIIRAFIEEGNDVR